MSRPRWTHACLFFLGLVYAATLLAGFLSPYDPADQNRTYPYAPPTRLHWVDPQSRFHFAPFVYAPQGNAAAEYHEDRGRAFPVRLLALGPPYRIAGIPSRCHLFAVDKPAEIFLLGTDGLGRDVWSRLLYGGRITLLAGLLAASIALLLGVLLGSIAGYYGGGLDALLMRLVELFLAMPWLYLLFAVRAFLPLRIGPVEAFFVIVLVIGMLGWARPARLIRGVVRSAREREYVLAARSAGAGPAYLLWHHILPQTGSVLWTQAALLIPQYMLAEVTLSYLGLGVGEPVATWGNMLQAVQQYPVLVNDWWMLAPGFAMIPIFWAFAVLVDRTQERIEFRHH